MDRITELFDRMDEWRHLPSYQLERRADLFFALYLPQVLEAKLGFPIEPRLIPEFPVHKRTLCPHLDHNRSFKIDYLALSKDATKVVLVELKTDNSSRRPEQDEALIAAQRAGLLALVEGVIALLNSSSQKRKYFFLLEHLADMGLVQVPRSLREIMARPNLQGVRAAAQEIEVTARASECLIVYVQPNGTEPNVISFQDFRAVVLEQSDLISQRFAQSLFEWAKVPAGEPRNLTKNSEEQ